MQKMSSISSVLESNFTPCLHLQATAPCLIVIQMRRGKVVAAAKARLAVDSSDYCDTCWV